MPLRRTAPRRTNRRRPNFRASIRYRRSARAQSQQIGRLARMAMTNRSILNRHKTWTDYTHGFDAGLPVNGWYAFPLIDPVLWTATMRQSVNVRQSPSTFIRNMRCSYTCTSPQSVERVYWSIYLCKLRSLAVDWRPVAGPTTNYLRPDVDYTLMGTGNMPQLNMNIFNIIGSKTFTTWQLADSSGDQLGNPLSSQSRGSMNRNVKYTLRTLPSQATAQATYWSQLTEEEIPCYEQMWLLVYPQTSNVAEAAATMDFSAYFTCVNTD